MPFGRIFGYLVDMSYRRPVRTTTPLYSELVHRGRPPKNAPKLSPREVFMRRRREDQLSWARRQRKAGEDDRVAG